MAKHSEALNDSKKKKGGFEQKKKHDQNDTETMGTTRMECKKNEKDATFRLKIK